MQHPKLVPMIFNQQMTSQIVSNDKSETRRLMTPQPSDKPIVSYDSEGLVSVMAHVSNRDQLFDFVPPANVGDILYVRETWQEVYETEYDEDDPRGYVDIRERILNFDDIPKVAAGISSDHSSKEMKPRMKYYVFKASDIRYKDPSVTLKWRPSIHMPRKAARLFLEVENVWPQSIQDVTVDEILSEGITWINPPPICQKAVSYPDSFPKEFDNWSKNKQEDWIRSAAVARYIGWNEYANNLFAEWKKLWDSTIEPSKINTYGYDANPYVWAYKFKRIEGDNLHE